MLTPDNSDLVRLCLQSAERFPERGIRFVTGADADEIFVSYVELDRRARRIARALSDLPQGSRVLLLFDPSVDFVEAFFGCLYAGMVAVPVPAPQPARFERQLARLRAIATDCQLAAVLTSQRIEALATSMFGLAPELAAVRWVATDSGKLPDPAGWSAPDIEPETRAFLQYTSGSTGTPRGVLVTHRMLSANLAMLQDFIGANDHHRFVSWLPMYHDMGLIGLLLSGVGFAADMWLMSPMKFLSDPASWIRLMSDVGCTTTATPNFGLALALRKVPRELDDTLDLSRLQCLCSAAEPIHPETIQGFVDRFSACGLSPGAVLPAYGLAEATLIVSGTRPGAFKVATVDGDALQRGEVRPPEAGAEPYALVSCGAICDGVDVAIADEDGRPVTGRVGEIWVAGPAVAAGYWGHEDHEAFGARLQGSERAWMRTGDLGFVLDGEVYVTGRAKDLIIIRGKNFYPQDLELTAERCSPYVRKGASAAIGLSAEGSEAVAIIAEVDTRRHDDLPLEQIRDAIRANVGDVHEVAVEQVRLIPAGSLPKTSSGKIQRSLAARMHAEGTFPELHTWSRPSETGPARGPEVLDEAGIAAFIQTWCENRLGRTVEPTDSFPRLGLDSVDLVELTNALRELLDRPDLSASVGIDHPSIPELAAHLVEAFQLVDATGPTPTNVPDGTLTSYFQDAVLAWEKAHDRSATWTETFPCRVDQPLDPQRLQRALDRVVARQTALLQRFTLEGLDGLVDAIEVEERPGDIAAVYPDLTTHAFRFDGSPLFRLVHVRGDGESSLVFVWHQLVHDGTGGPLLAEELLAAYAGQALPALALRYVDYAAWERRYFQGAGLPQVMAARRRVEGARRLPAPQAPAEHGTRAAGRRVVLAEDEAAPLFRFLQARDVTFFVGMVSIVSLALHRLTGATDIALSAPTGTRKRAELQDVVGRFGAWTPFRLAIDGPHLEAVLGQVRTQSALALDPVPGPVLFERDDVFDHPAMRVIVNTPAAGPPTPIRSGDLVATPLPRQKEVTARVDLTVLGLPVGKAIVLRAGSAGRFTQASIDELLDTIRRIVAELP